MHTLTIKHGLSSARREYQYSPTVQDIKQDSSLRAELGYGDNIRVLINGAEQPNHITIPAGVSLVTVETAANQKAN